MFAHGHVIVCPCVGLRRVVFKVDGKDGESFPGTLHVAAMCMGCVGLLCVCVIHTGACAGCCCVYTCTVEPVYSGHCVRQPPL